VQTESKITIPRFIFFPVRPAETIQLLRSRLCGLFDNIGHSDVTQRSKIVNSLQYFCALHPELRQQQVLAAPLKLDAAAQGQVHAMAKDVT
jgi:hypothetical protein